ncbi:Hypothetical protein A7982_03523 [Minicystis rosea]|nr:Hypothetical protein A7982_03523 [Minicystis rosea]
MFEAAAGKVKGLGLLEAITGSLHEDEHVRFQETDALFPRRYRRGLECRGVLSPKSRTARNPA